MKKFFLFFFFLPSFLFAQSASIDAGGGSGSSLNPTSSILTADFTNATASLTTTALTVNLVAGKKYSYNAVLYGVDSVAAEGVQIEDAGGTATFTNFRKHCLIHSTVLEVSAQGGFGSVCSDASLTGNFLVQLQGGMEVLSSGTFAIRAAQNTHATGTLTLHRGSYLVITEIP